MTITREYIAGILCAMQITGDDETSAEIEQFIVQLEAEIEALGGKNNMFHNALSDIADTSPNWMQKNAVEDSERRMRQIAQDALLAEGGENAPVYVTQLETELAEYKKHFEPQMIQIRLRRQATARQEKTYKVAGGDDETE